MGSSRQGFYPNMSFFQGWVGGYKTRVIKPGELSSTFQKKQKNEFICVKLVIILIFCNEKVPFYRFFIKDLNKSSLLNCVPRVLKTCSRVNVSCVLTCLACLRANVPFVLMYSRVNVPCVLTWSRANAPCVLTCRRALRAYVLMCQQTLRAYVLTWQRALHAYVLTCQRALHAYVPTCLACLRDQVPTCLAH